MTKYINNNQLEMKNTIIDINNTLEPDQHGLVVKC